MKNTAKFGSFSITTSLDEINLNDGGVINTINPHSYVVSNKDYYFKRALIQSDYLFPDGVGIVLAHRILNGGRIHKIAGYDIFIYMMTKLNDIKGSCFFLGSSNKTLELIKTKATKEFPDVHVSYYSPPYKESFTTKDSKKMISAVNAAKPGVLFVGMTAPKQEKWVNKNKDLLFSETICSIGAVFDFYAGNFKRAPKLIINLGLEWLFRSIQSRRLFKRNFVSNPKFIFCIIKEKYFKLV